MYNHFNHFGSSSLKCFFRETLQILSRKFPKNTLFYICISTCKTSDRNVQMVTWNISVVKQPLFCEFLRHLLSAFLRIYCLSVAGGKKNFHSEFLSRWALSLDWVRWEIDREIFLEILAMNRGRVPIYRNDKCISIIAARCGIGRGELPRVSRLDESAAAN